MKLYSVGDEFTGESRFYSSKAEAMSAARAQANHHGHTCYVEKHEFKATRPGD